MTVKHFPAHFIFLFLIITIFSISGTAQQNSALKRDGQHDFDWEIGRWKTHLKRLKGPLTGSTTWVEYDGTTVVRKVWDGRANLVELNVTGPAGHIEALSLRLYNPESRQWSLNFSNSASGTLSTPTVGEFKNGPGRILRPGNSQRSFDLCSVYYCVFHAGHLQL
jgi:hypothetical protein